MFVPITSEVIIKTGMILKEIATDHLFTISERLKTNPDVAGEDKWRIFPVSQSDPNQISRVFARQELSEKYFAEV